MSTVPVALMNKASGTFNTVRQVGGALGIAILAAVFAAHGNDRSPLAFANGFAAAIVAAAVMAFVGAASGLFAPGRKPVVASPASPPARVLEETAVAR
jgi:hypothetical protein